MELWQAEAEVQFSHMLGQLAQVLQVVRYCLFPHSKQVLGLLDEQVGTLETCGAIHGPSTKRNPTNNH